MIKKTFAIMAFLLTIATQSWADGEKQWHVVADNNQAVPVSNVAYLVAADDGKFLNIVLNDETVIANVSNITFEERNTTAIALPDNDGAAGLTASRSLNFSMLPAGTPIELYTTDGRLLRRTTAATLSIADLQRGSYLIKVNKTTIKLQKKS